MKLVIPLAFGLALLFGSSCNSCSKKPTEPECRAAIENVRHILGLDRNTAGVEINKAIRSCRGSSSKETAKCLAEAKTEADLAACEGDVGEKYLEQEREAERKRLEKVRKSEADKAGDKTEGDKTEGDSGDKTEGGSGEETKDGE